MFENNIERRETYSTYQAISKSSKAIFNENKRNLEVDSVEGRKAHWLLIITDMRNSNRKLKALLLPG